MYNPTRRTRRFKQPLSLTRALDQLPETNDIHVPNEDGSPIYVRHRQGGSPSDAVRGAMLVALILVTIILYIVLWELEKSSFVSVPKPNSTHRVAAAVASWSGSSQTVSPQYLSAAVRWQDQPVVIPNKSSTVRLSNDHTDLFSNKSDRTTGKVWPPPVTRVPEERVTEDLVEESDGLAHGGGTVKVPSFDAAYCNGPCRFLLPVRIGEQESKARAHFMQLWMLARRLNRTIVLPNVGHSRMGACSEWPFGAYYDTNELTKGRGARPAIDLERFAKWADKRPEPSTSFVVSMESIRRDHRDPLASQGDVGDMPFIVQKTEVSPKILSCLESKLARLRSSLPYTALSVSFDSGSLSDPSTRLVQLLSNSMDLDTNSDLDLMVEPVYEYPSQYTNASHFSFADIEVLILDYDLRHPLFPASMTANFNLHYAPALYDLADRLSDNLGPFLGVHWRMENVPVQNLAWCAASLVSTLHARLRDDDARESVRYVWLATDHPRPLGSFADVVRFPVDNGDRMTNDVGSGKDAGGRSLPNYGPPKKSSTFRALSVEHDDAIGLLLEAFQSGGDLETWMLTDLAEQLRWYPYVEGRFEVDDALLGDSGVFGIIDKLVVVQARMFVSGSAECSKTSSFSRQIIETRQESFKAERGRGIIRNVVEYFGKW